MRVPVVTPRAFRRLALADVALLVAVVATGTAVRLTDSGLGCADWPNCNADDFVSVGSGHEAIEQLNRVFSGLIAVPIVAALVAAYRRVPRRRDLVALGWLMLALYLANAVLGGVAVLVELAWVSVMGHFLLAVALVGVGLVVCRHAWEDEGPYRPVVARPVVLLARGVFALTVWVLVAGTLVTAAGPHGGDPDARRLSWPITDVARVHAVSVDVLVGLVVVLVLALVRRGAPRPVARAASLALAAMVAQGTLGYVQYAQAIPELLVAFHVVGAVVVFGAVQWLQLTLRVPVGSADRASPRLAAAPALAASLES